MWCDLTILFLQCWLFWQDGVSGRRNDPTGLETSPAPSSPGTTWTGGNNSSGFETSSAPASPETTHTGGNNSSGFEISLTPASPGTTDAGGNNSSGFETSSAPASPGTTHTGGNDFTGLETSPYPISLGTTQSVLTRSLDFTWGNIFRLGLGACVLLALVLIMAAASYCWKETPGSLDPATQR